MIWFLLLPLILTLLTASVAIYKSDNKTASVADNPDHVPLPTPGTKKQVIQADDSGYATPVRVPPVVMMEQVTTSAAPLPVVTQIPSTIPTPVVPQVIPQSVPAVVTEQVTTSAAPLPVVTQIPATPAATPVVEPPVNAPAIPTVTFATNPLAVPNGFIRAGGVMGAWNEVTYPYGGPGQDTMEQAAAKCLADPACTWGQINLGLGAGGYFNYKPTTDNWSDAVPTIVVDYKPDAFAYPVHAGGLTAYAGTVNTTVQPVVQVEPTVDNTFTTNRINRMASRRAAAAAEAEAAAAASAAAAAAASVTVVDPSGNYNQVVLTTDDLALIQSSAQQAWDFALAGGMSDVAAGNAAAVARQNTMSLILKRYFGNVSPTDFTVDELMEITNAVNDALAQWPSPSFADTENTTRAATDLKIREILARKAGRFNYIPNKTYIPPANTGPLYVGGVGQAFPTLAARNRCILDPQCSVGTTKKGVSTYYSTDAGGTYVDSADAVVEYIRGRTNTWN